MIDLDNCKFGDILLTNKGNKVSYLKKEPLCMGLHFVKYLTKDCRNGIRTDEGLVVKNSWEDSEDMIISIIHKSEPTVRRPTLTKKISSFDGDALTIHDSMPFGKYKGNSFYMLTSTIQGKNYLKWAIQNIGLKVDESIKIYL